MWINAPNCSIYTWKAILFLVICSIFLKDSFRLLPNYATYGIKHCSYWLIVKLFPQVFFIFGLVIYRLEWNESCVEQFLFVLRYCRKTLPKLERLVLVNSSGSLCHPSYSGLEDLLIAFVEKMPELVALCLVGFQIDPITIKVISRRLTEEIVRPLRPSLWFHIGQELPTANDPSAPRIHFDEIVNPLDKFYTPPHFF